MTRLPVIILLLLAIAGVCAVVVPVVGKSGDNPSVHGDYDVIFKGQFVGTGQAQVNGSKKNRKVVYIRGDLLAAKKGGAGKFLVVDLPLSDDGHFSGPGKFTLGPGNKIDVTVVGRVEPPDGVVIKKARLICTFTTETGEAGRIYGAH